MRELGNEIAATERALRSELGAYSSNASSELQAKGFKDPIAAYELKGVRGRHDTLLPEAQEEMRPLAREIPVSFTVVDGTHVRQASAEGRFVRSRVGINGTTR